MAKYYIYTGRTNKDSKFIIYDHKLSLNLNNGTQDWKVAMPVPEATWVKENFSIEEIPLKLVKLKGWSFHK